MKRASAQASRRGQSEAKVKMGEVRRARLLLTSFGFASCAAEAHAELTDPNLCATQLSEEVPQDLLNFVPRVGVKLDHA